jgi:hypothetical protein
MWSTPKGLALPATGLAGSAARTRRTGRGTDNAAAQTRGVRNTPAIVTVRPRPARGSAVSLH